MEDQSPNTTPKNAVLDYENSVEHDLLTSDDGARLAEQYALFNKIHESRMSQVFVIQDRANGEKRILKAIRLHADQVCDVQALRQIDHPKVERILEIRATDRYLYVVKEFIQGITLQAYVDKHGPLPEEEAIRIGLELCGILSYFHRQKPFPVIYRDLKPANVILQDNGDIKLIDLDSVRLFKQDTRKDTCFIGTEGYASPEQFGFRQTDGRTDIYTLGATLYGLLAGHHPEPSRFGLKPIRQVRKDVSVGLSRLISKCTAFSPEHRYQHADSLRVELERCHRRASASTAHGSIGWLQNLMTRFSISPAALLILLVSVLLFSLSIGALAHTIRRQDRLLANQAPQMAHVAEPNGERPSIQVEPIGGKHPIQSDTSGTSGPQTVESPDNTAAEGFHPQEDADQALDITPTSSFMSASTAKASAASESMLPVPASSDPDVPALPSTQIESSPSPSQSFQPEDSQSRSQPFQPEDSPSPSQPIQPEDSPFTSASPSPSPAPGGFSYDKTTIREAFWSGEIPKTLPAWFVEYYKQQTSLRYNPDMFYISIAEWNPARSYEQMGERVQAVNSDILLRAAGQPDVRIEITANSMTQNDGSAMLYEVYIEDPELMKTGIAYHIVDPYGHWFSDPGVTVTRTKDPEKASDFAKTTILEAFWSGQAPTVTEKPFQDFVKNGSLFDPNQFFVAIKEWDFTRGYSQMGERVRQVGGNLMLVAEGHPEVPVRISDGSMSANNGNGQIYFTYVLRPELMVSGVPYRLVDTSGYWVVLDTVRVTRP